MASTAREKFDIAIVGGGLVGSSLACALENCGLNTVLIESADSPRAPSGFDQRKLALAKRSVDALTSLAVMPLLQTAATPIQRIHVSREGDFGRVMLDAGAFGQPFFGAVVLAQDLGHALAQRVSGLANCRRICPATVTATQVLEHGIALDLQSSAGRQQIEARLVVGADGTDSFIRNAAGIGVHQVDYQQTLFVCTLMADTASNGCAFERFSAQGPVALLPMSGGGYGAICCVESSQAKSVAAMDDDAYARYFQQRFGWRAGKILSVGKRTHYPLRRQLAEQISAPHTVLMGNAAQTIHPIGAQGFNLGLRDALGLVELLDAVPDFSQLPGRYAAYRAEDRERTLAFSDGMARLTRNEDLASHVLRSAALTAVGAMPGLASAWVTGAMGYRSRRSVPGVLS